MASKKNKKKKSRNKKVWIVILVLAVLIAAVLILSVQIKKKNFLLNPLFVTKNDTVGVDISNHQGEVDMEILAAQGVSFVYMKATEGSSFVDPEFAENWENAKAAGLLSGAYHFFSFDSDGETQAESFIRTVGDISGRLIPVVDVEFYGENREAPPEREEVIASLRKYLEILENEYGVKPMIYMSPAIYKTYLEGEFDGYPKWISSVFYPPVLDYKGDWVLWQYTDRGKYEGYYGREEYIDLDVLNRKVSLESLIVG